MKGKYQMQHNCLKDTLSHPLNFLFYIVTTTSNECKLGNKLHTHTSEQHTQQPKFNDNGWCIVCSNNATPGYLEPPGKINVE